MRIGVVGLGLIGGSIFKKASEKYEVVGVSRSVNADNVDDDYSVLRYCDVVFVCTPMNKTLEILDKIENYVREETIVTDVCSLKEFVAEKKYKFKFIPSHPMAGTENQGWEASFSELFKGAKWAVTPNENTDIKDFETLKSVIKNLGAEVIVTTPKEHDRAVALISHAPMLIAQALCKNIENETLAQKLASTGFKDTTRLALSNIEMASDMVHMNETNIRDAVEMLQTNIEALLSGNYKEKSESIKAFRQGLYSADSL